MGVPVKTLKRAGDLFQEELLYRFGCDFERDITPCEALEGPLDRLTNLVGDAFVAELLRRFSNDGLYREDGETT
ncbi:MAG: hypothetical protein MRJ68_16315 [Nitrospira sp.]|nr:hypothetical protein [Nitrospira sp.]